MGRLINEGIHRAKDKNLAKGNKKYLVYPAVADLAFRRKIVIPAISEKSTHKIRKYSCHHF